MYRIDVVKPFYYYIILSEDVAQTMDSTTQTLSLETQLETLTIGLSKKKSKSMNKLAALEIEPRISGKFEPQQPLHGTSN